MSFVSLILLNRNENIEKIDLQFKKETWQSITEWHTEILNGNTIYIVKYKKGRLGIYPSKYTQIRDINEKTKIKCLVGKEKDGLFFPKRLEIQN